MNYQKTTQIPNVFFDFHIPKLSGSEIKILLIIVRQTYGWIAQNGKRKKRDRISYSQFETKTGISRRVISHSIQSLIDKKLIRASEFGGKVLLLPSERKGKNCIYYTPLLQTSAQNNAETCTFRQKGVQKSHTTKPTLTKLTRQKGRSQGKKRISDWERVQQIMQQQL